MKIVNVLLILTSIITAQELEFGGYAEVENRITFSEDIEFSDRETFRLEGRREFKSASIDAHLLFNTGLQPLDPMSGLKSDSRVERIYGQLLQGVMGTLPQDVSLDLLSDPDFIEQIEGAMNSNLLRQDEVIVDRLVIQLWLGIFDVMIGRQSIAWGTGYAWNPTDVWNAKNPTDPAAPTSGVNAIRLKTALGELSELDIVALPGANPEQSSYGIRYKTNTGSYDLSLVAGRLMNADRVLLGLPERVFVGYDLAGQIIGDIGVWMETSVNNHYEHAEDAFAMDSLWVQADAGLDYTFENGLYVSLEYFFNGLGKADEKDYGATEFRYMSGSEMPGFGRHYLMLGTNRGFWESYTWSLYALNNVTDYSWAFVPGLLYQYDDDIQMQLGATFFAGDKDYSEYGSYYSSGFMKVTGYF